MKGLTMKSKLGLFPVLFLSTLCASAVDINSDTTTSALADNNVIFQGDYTVTVDSNYKASIIGGGNVNASFYIKEGNTFTINIQKPSESYKDSFEGTLTFNGDEGTVLNWISNGWSAQFGGKLNGTTPLLDVVFNTDFVYNQNGVPGNHKYFTVNRANYEFNKNVSFVAQEVNGTTIGIGLIVGNGPLDSNVLFGKVGSESKYTADISGTFEAQAGTTTVNKNYTLNFAEAAKINAGAVLNIEEGGKVSVAYITNSGTVNINGGTLAITTGEIAQSVIDGLNITKPSTIEVFNIKLKGHTLDYGTLAVNGNAVINTGTFTIEEGNSFIVNTTTDGGSFTNGTGSDAGIVDINGAMLITGGAFRMWNDSRINVNSTGSLGTAEKAVTVLDIYSKAILNLDGYSNINTLKTATNDLNEQNLWQTINVTSSTNNIETLGINSAILNVENGGKLTVANLTVNEKATEKCNSFVYVKDGGILEVTKSLNLSSTNFNLSGTLILGALETSSITGKLLVDGGKLVMGTDVAFEAGLKIADGSTMQIELNGHELVINSIEGENICLDFISNSVEVNDTFLIENIEESYLNSIDIKVNGADALVDYQAFGAGYLVNIQIPEPAEYAAVFALLALGFAIYRRK